MKEGTMIGCLSGHGCRTKLDAFDLAGIKLSQEEKQLMKELNITADMLSKLSNGFSDQSNEIRKIAEELNKTIHPPKSKRRIKNWEKKRFYD